MVTRVLSLFVWFLVFLLFCFLFIVSVSVSSYPSPPPCRFFSSFVVPPPSGLSLTFDRVHPSIQSSSSFAPHSFSSIYHTFILDHALLCTPSTFYLSPFILLSTLLPYSFFPRPPFITRLSRFLIRFAFVLPCRIPIFSFASHFFRLCIHLLLSSYFHLLLLNADPNIFIISTALAIPTPLNPPVRSSTFRLSLREGSRKSFTNSSGAVLAYRLVCE